MVLSALRADYEDGRAAAAFMLLYQGGQAALLVGSSCAALHIRRLPLSAETMFRKGWNSVRSGHSRFHTAAMLVATASVPVLWTLRVLQLQPRLY